MARQRRPNRGVWRTVLLAVLGLVLGLSLYSWNARSLVGNRLPMPFGYGVSVVLSGSMEPTLSVDDLVLLKECGRYELGDIVVYQSGDILVIHRLVALDGDLAVTQGDANVAPDAPIPQTAIKGRLVGSVPYAGRLVRWLKSPVGLALLLGGALLLLELSWQREKQADSAELEQLKEEIRRLKEK